MTLRFSKKTGNVESSSTYDERMEGVFEDLINYEKKSIGSNSFKQIKNQTELKEWLESVGAKGAGTGGLAKAISRTDKYDSITQENKSKPINLKEEREQNKSKTIFWIKKSERLERENRELKQKIERLERERSRK